MDKYSILAISIIIIVVIFSYFQLEDDEDNIIGFADNIQKKDSGYIFYIQDSNGNSIKAFSNSIVDGSLHKFYGNYSSDGSIFFISHIE